MFVVNTNNKARVKILRTTFFETPDLIFPPSGSSSRTKIENRGSGYDERLNFFLRSCKTFVTRGGFPDRGGSTETDWVPAEVHPPWRAGMTLLRCCPDDFGEGDLTVNGFVDGGLTEREQTGRFNRSAN
jgi:hypothetical protein